MSEEPDGKAEPGEPTSKADKGIRPGVAEVSLPSDLDAAPLCAVTNRAAHWLTSWWHSPAGVRLFAEQAPFIAAEVRRFHGDRLLWLGCHNPSGEFVRRCMVRHRFYAAIPGTHPSPDIASFYCDPQELPMAKGSVNAVMLHHTLECVPDPRGFIREIARVMEPGGRLVVCGFNPLSSWGASSLAARCARLLGRDNAPLKLLTSSRLLDWLALLGFELSDAVRYVSYPLPKGDYWQPYHRWLAQRRIPIGASYILSATKQQGAQLMRPDKQALRQRPLAPVAYPKLATWGRVEQDN